jgi:hypothetical protein
MAEDPKHRSASGKEQAVDKQLARRERQAQSLRRNLSRRKAQMRERIDDGPPEVTKDESLKD